MAYRILHCGDSLENYYKCIDNKVVGFSKTVAKDNDVIFIVVRVNKKAFCGARVQVLGESNLKPWENPEHYKQSLNIIKIEYSNPFLINTILKEAGGQYWMAKYLQGAKEIKDQKAIEILELTFSNNKREDLYKFELNEKSVKDKGSKVKKCEEIHIKNKNDKCTDELDIMGTFQTISFVNETDEIKGLEKLVTKNFYNLFTKFNQDRTILISDNRKFSTAKVKNDKGNNINGISGIPDGLLIEYDNTDKNNPIQIKLIEYECYGEGKTTAKQKSDYLNCHIIPQLMRFASTFSIVTDYKIREQTIKSWVDKITAHIYSNNELSDKTSVWIKELDPNIHVQQFALKLNELLKEAFEKNISIMLIIDELTIEQKDTIKNIIGAFKLNNEIDSSVKFSSYVVRLEKRINIVDNNAQYALSYQE